jgi:hypothetical protein
MRKLRLDFVELAAPSPFSLPLMEERLREQSTTEKLADRLARVIADAEAALAERTGASKRTVVPPAAAPESKADSSRRTDARRRPGGSAEG